MGVVHSSRKELELELRIKYYSFESKLTMQNPKSKSKPKFYMTFPTVCNLCLVPRTGLQEDEKLAVYLYLDLV